MWYNKEARGPNACYMPWHNISTAGLGVYEVTLPVQSGANCRAHEKRQQQVHDARACAEYSRCDSSLQRLE